MKEFIEKLIGRLEEVHKDYICDLVPNCDEFKNCKDCRKEFIKKIIEPVLEEYKDKTIVDEQYCWQTCGATEHCKECNRLCNGSIDYYENYDFMAEEHNGGWIPCSERLPDYSDTILVCTKNGGRTLAHLKHTTIGWEWRDMYMNKIDGVIAWQPLPPAFKPKGE